MRKIFSLALVIVFSLVLSGCGGKNNSVSDGNLENKTTAKQEVVAGKINVCQEGKVDLLNYGDPGKRLKNCFVEYPGEPSRPDKSYYIVEDICGQFTQQFLENMLEKKLVKIELPKVSGLNNCTYYFDDQEYVMLNLEYLAIENQKAGNEAIGYRTEKSLKIPMENLVVWQDNNLINAIFLVMSPNKFISLRPASKKSFATADQFLGFAANLGEALKKYK